MAGCGTIFNLKPGATAPASAIAPWSETVLYSFQGTPDGEYPANGPLVFDQAGAAYGTTPFGGNHQGCLRETCGVVYKLVRSGGNWVESVLYAFAGDPDGAQPYGGVIMDEAGNLYGTTYQGGAHGWGTVFELTPSQGGWTKTTLYQFTGGSDGGQTSAGLTRDSAGNLYGVTPLGGFGSGTIFELSRVGGQWTFTVLYSLIRGGPGPFAPLTIDTAGNLYGTTMGTGIYGGGELFELSPSGAGWTYSVLHDFTWGAGGALPQSPVLLSPSGELYGTTYEGGGGGCGNGCGTVWQFTR